MQKIYKIVILVLFLIGGTLFLFNNFISNYNNEIEKTEYKINGIEFAQKIQKFILKIQKLRGYSQFDKFLVDESEYSNILNSVELIKTDVKKEMKEIRALKSLYPELYDNSYDYVMDNIIIIIDGSIDDKIVLYQKYTHAIEELKERAYYLGFKSKLLLESDGDKYFFVEVMLKHLPNLIEVVGKIRAKTTKAILDNSTDNELLYSIKNNCLLCEEHIKQIYKAVDEIYDDNEKTRLFSLLENINSETQNMQQYVKNTVLLHDAKIEALEFFKISTNVIDKMFILYTTDAEFLSQKLNQKLEKLKKTKLYGIVIGAFVVLLIFLTIASMLRSYILYVKSEKKIKNNLTSIIDLKNDLEKCNTIEEIASSSLYFFANKFGVVQGAIYIYNEENNKLYLASSYATNKMKPIVELGEGLVGEVAVQKKGIQTDLKDNKKINFRIEDISIEPSNICTIPLISYEQIFGVLQLGFMQKHEIVNNEDFTYFIDMIIGFLRNAKYSDTNRQYLELIDKYVITSKTNKKGIITDVSDAFTKISGYTKEEIIGKAHSIVAHPDTPKELYEEMWETILQGKIYEGEIKNLNKSGAEYWIETTITPTKDKYENILGFSAIIRDITDKKRIEEYSITDGLTELYNRRFFDINFNKERKISKRDNKNLALLIVDIDYFKQYNDTYGHQRGDEILKSVALAMKSLFKRASDYVYRLGGEEFAVSFYTNDKESALNRAESLRKSIEDLKIEHLSSAISNYLSISIGVTFIPKECAMEVDEIYKITDKALYSAKNSGRNRVVEATINL
ncbi:MAG TPA: diguanylate cyclase [Sulfurimonas sp.]|uniref:sensor domain-containing diguanylate cyclase n=1 Tax=Sulfurimonas sp. TaxID=2022749 RepID=UPI002B9EDFA5|nr:diguanylate cyclase [Sulfurimonas sp.]HUH41694.1 diguanylate cyclase [Sulfurimonas sp.]